MHRHKHAQYLSTTFHFQRVSPVLSLRECIVCASLFWTGHGIGARDRNENMCSFLSFPFFLVFLSFVCINITLYLTSHRRRRQRRQWQRRHATHTRCTRTFALNCSLKYWIGSMHGSWQNELRNERTNDT